MVQTALCNGRLAVEQVVMTQACAACASQIHMLSGYGSAIQDLAFNGKGALVGVKKTAEEETVVSQCLKLYACVCGHELHTIDIDTWCMLEFLSR